MLDLYNKIDVYQFIAFVLPEIFVGIDFIQPGLYHIVHSICTHNTSYFKSIYNFFVTAGHGRYRRSADFASEITQQWDFCGISY